MNMIFRLLATILIISVSSSEMIGVEPTNGCPPSKIQLKGKCFDKIPGCQIYNSATQCQKCDQNSTLTEGKCFMTMNASDLLLLSLLKPKTPGLKGPEKQNKMTFLDQVNFNNIKNIIVSKYPLFANTSSSPSIRGLLRSSFETLYLFSWVNSKNKNYLFQFDVDFDGITTELISDQFDPNLENSSFSKIHARIGQKYAIQLSDSTLTRIVSISKNLYKLHYYSDFGFHYVSFIQKIPFLQIKPLETVPWKYDEQELLSYIYSQHPFLVTQKSWEIKKKDTTKPIRNQVKFKSQSQVVLQEISGQRQSIIFFLREQNQTISTSNTKPVGSYQVLRNKEDQLLRKVINHIYSEFTILKNTDIVKIEYQIVAGTNFLIHLRDKKSIDQYICKAFYSLTGQINILQVYLNSVLVHSQPLAPLQSNSSYKHSDDSLFPSVIYYIKVTKNLQCPEDILYVNKIKKSNDINTFYQFQIVYQANSFIIASYFIDGPKVGSIQVNDFIYNGDNLLDEEDNSDKIQQIKEFLEGYRKWTHPVVIEYLKETEPNKYLLKVITEYGSYFFKIIDTKITGYQIYYYELIDEKENCMTRSSEEVQKFYRQQKPFVTNLLASNNLDPAYQLVSLSEGIISSKTRFRLLFVNPSNSKKVHVFIRAEMDGMVVDDIQDENNGLYIMTNTDLYNKAIEKAQTQLSESLKGASCLYSMMNSRSIFLYFSKPSSQSLTKQTVYQVSLDLQLTQKPTLSLFLQQEQSKTCKKIDVSGNCLQCKESTITLMSQCYSRIKNCRIQLGEQCMVCENQYSLIDNQCVNECGAFM